MEGQMEQFNSLLPQVVRAGASSNEVVQVAVSAAWNHIVGESLRQYAVPMGFREKVLTVAVTDTIWKKQLQSMLGQLIARTNAALGQSLVRSVEFVIHPDAIAQAGRQRTSVHTRSPNPEPLPPELTEAAASIADPRLRGLFTEAAQSCLQRLKESGSR